LRWLDYDKFPFPRGSGNRFEGRVCPKIEPAKAKNNHQRPAPDQIADYGSIWLLIGSQNAKTPADLERTLPNSGLMDKTPLIPPVQKPGSISLLVRFIFCSSFAWSLLQKTPLRKPRTVSNRLGQAWWRGRESCIRLRFANI